MIKYGLISETDWNTITKTLDLVMESTDEVINTCEIGIYSGATSFAICEYIQSKERKVNHIGIDNIKDGEPILHFPLNQKFIRGNSTEVYYKVEDNSQDFIFIDGDHSYIGVISDFFAYSSKVKNGGYLLFHDTGKHIKPLKDFQHGDKNNPDSYISVRKALINIGLINLPNDYINKQPQWEIVFDEADISNDAGGVIVIQKIK